MRLDHSIYRSHLRVNAAALDHLIKQRVDDWREDDARTIVRRLHRSSSDFWNQLINVPSIIEAWYNEMADEIGHRDSLTNLDLLLSETWKNFCRACSRDPHVLTPTDRNYGHELTTFFLDAAQDAVLTRFPIEKRESRRRRSPDPPSRRVSSRSFTEIRDAYKTNSPDRRESSMTERFRNYGEDSQHIDMFGDAPPEEEEDDGAMITFNMGDL